MFTRFFFFFSFLSFIFFLFYIYFSFIIIIIIIIINVYVFSTCTGLVAKRIKFPQGLSLVLYSYFRTLYLCIVELWVIVSLKYREKNCLFWIKYCLITYSKVLTSNVTIIIQNSSLLTTQKYFCPKNIFFVFAWKFVLINLRVLAIVLQSFKIQILKHITK